MDYGYMKQINQSTVALVWIFNQKQHINAIEKIKHIYSTRFSHMWFLVPYYYVPNSSDIIPYYAHQYFFELAWYEFSKIELPDNIKTVVFIGDDVFLNQKIDEDNFLKILRINDDDAFVQNGRPFSNFMLAHFNESITKTYVKESILHFNENKKALMQLDPHKDLIAKFQQYGHYNIRAFADIQAVDSLLNNKEIDINGSSSIEDKFPLLLSYCLSDFVVIPQAILKEFGKIAKIYGDSKIFVEYSLFPCLLHCIEPQKIKSLCNTPLYFSCFNDNVTQFRVFDPLYYRHDCIGNAKNELVISDFPENFIGAHQVKLSFLKQRTYQINKVITFASINIGYKMHKAYKRWTKQLKNLEQIDVIEKNGSIVITEDDLDDNYKSKFQKYFNDHGLAWYSWKPYIIKQQLQKMKYGESLCYFDAGNVLPFTDIQQKCIMTCIMQAIDSMHTDNYDIALPYLKDVKISWTMRRQVAEYFNLENDVDFLNNTEYYEAGVIVLVKTHKIEKLINDWTQFCFDHYDLIQSKSLEDDIMNKIGDTFLCNVGDQAILQCLLYKNKYNIYKLDNEIRQIIKRYRD